MNSQLKFTLLKLLIFVHIQMISPCSCHHWLEKLLATRLVLRHFTSQCLGLFFILFPGKCTAGEEPVTWKACKPCDTGFYKSIPGIDNCTPCALGLFTVDTGSTSIENCVGTFWDGLHEALDQ